MIFNNIKSLVVPEGEVVKIANSVGVLWQRQPYQLELEYIESTGEQYIDTGIRGNNDNLRIEFSFMLLVFKSYAGIFGNYVNEDSNAWRMIQGGTDNSRGLITPNRKANGASQTISLAKNKKHTFSMDAKKYVLNGSTVNFGTLTKGAENDMTICIFTQFANSISRSALRLYYFKIYDSDVLVRDLIPVLDDDGIPCMYDKISGELFYNKGTGQFATNL